MSYEDFKILVETNPSVKRRSSEQLGQIYKTPKELIISYRNLLKQEILVPYEEELEEYDSSVDSLQPKNIKGFEVSSFKINSKGELGETWYKKPDEEILKEKEVDLQYLKEFLSKSIKSTSTNKKVFSDKVLFLYYGDAHIGMKLQKDCPLNVVTLDFKETLLKGLDIITEYFKEVVVVYGGDMTDSVLNETSRKGHYLPSTLNDREMFEVFIEGSKNLFNNLVSNKYVGKVSFYSVSEDNHTGYLAGIQSRALEIWLNSAYPDIETNVFSSNISFVEKYGHTYIFTHGKDSKQMFKNLPLVLDTKTETYLMSWCLSNNIKPNYKNTHIVKFDLHQSSYQLGKFFSYLNCLSMQVGSDWQQHNFMSSIPGITYTIQTEYGLMNGEILL